LYETIYIENRRKRIRNLNLNFTNEKKCTKTYKNSSEMLKKGAF
jgi:hypothetical protein